MKTLKESLLDDIDTTMNSGTNGIIVDMLFDKDLNKRRQGFEQLLSKVESYRPKEHKTTAKMKSSDSYFVEFTRPIKVEDGELTNEILDWISYIQICKRMGLDYITVCINASDDRFGDQIVVFETKWHYAQANFNPKAGNTKLYEVPEELNDLFRQIQAESYKCR